MGLHLSQIDEADELLTNDPLALLIGMVLDQPVSEGWSETGVSCPFDYGSATRRSVAAGARSGASDHVGV